MSSIGSWTWGVSSSASWNVKCSWSESRNECGKPNFSPNHIKYFQALYLFDGGNHTVGKRPPQQSNLWKICKTKVHRPSFIFHQRSQSKYVKYLGLDLINGFELLSAIYFVCAHPQRGTSFQGWGGGWRSSWINRPCWSPSRMECLVVRWWVNHKAMCDFLSDQLNTLCTNNS